MNPVAFLRQTLIWLRYRHAAFVNSRDELEAAMQRMPRRIVVDGDESLRAYAASIAVPRRGTVAAPAQEVPDRPGLLAVSPVGRIRDGYRRKRRASGRQPPAGEAIGLPLLVLSGTLSALAAELLASFGWPAGDMRVLAHGKAAGRVAPATLDMWLERGAAILLAVFAALCIARATWLVLGLGFPRRTAWQVEYRVPGRLVMTRTWRRGAR